MKEIVEGLEKVYDEFKTENDEALLALYASNDEKINTYVGGSIKSVSQMIHYVLHEGLKEGADKTFVSVAHSIMVGVREFLSIPTAQSIVFSNEMVKGIIDAKKLISGVTNPCEKCSKRMTCDKKDAECLRNENVPYDEIGN